MSDKQETKKPTVRRRRFIRRLRIFIAITIVHVVVGFVVVPYLIPEDAIRMALEKEIEEELQCDAEISGVSVSFLSGLTVDEIKITNARRLNGNVSIVAGSANIKASLLPLLRKKISLNEITLIDPVIIFHKEAEEMPVTDVPSVKKQAKPELKAGFFGVIAASLPKSSTEDRAEYKIEAFPCSLIIKNGLVTYVGEEDDEPVEVKKIDARVELLSEDEVVITNARFSVPFPDDRFLALRARGHLIRKDDTTTIKFNFTDFDMGTALGIPTMPVSNLQMDVLFDGKYIELKVLSCASSGGKVSLSCKGTMPGLEEDFELKLKIENLQVDEGLSSLLRYSDPLLSGMSVDKLGGRINADLDVSGRGYNAKSIRKTLRGKGSYRMTDGVISSTFTDELASLAKHEKLSKMRFDSVAADFSIRDQYVTSDAISMTGPDVEISMSGYTRFDGKTRYKMKLDPWSVLGENSEKTAMFVGLDHIPLRIKGTINHPKVDIDWKAVRSSAEEANPDIKNLIDGFKDIFGGSKDKDKKRH